MGYCRNRLRVGATLAIVAAIALIAGGKPSEARAADGTTDVTAQVAEGDENLAWSAPTQIPMKATAGGTLIGPGADAIAIRNLSAFPIRVMQMDTTAETPFHLVDNVDKSSGSNDFMMTVNGAVAKQTVELPDDGTWSMGYKGNEKGSDKLPLTISGAKIARVTEDLSAAKKAATVTWTVKPTTTIKPEPKPAPENGVAFAVYSDDDKSFNFYKRDRKPEVGDTFNGKAGTEIIDINETSYYYDEPFNNIGWITKKIEVVDSGIKPISTVKWFRSFSSANSANVIKLDTSADTDMSSMFSGCSSLTSLDLSSWDVSKVEYMCDLSTGGMFENCSSLASLDISGWETSSIKSLRSMFSYCSNLTSLDISGWDTSNVREMIAMFQGCSSLTTLDLSSWDRYLER